MTQFPISPDQPPAESEMPITLRPASAFDEPFLLDLRRATMTEHLDRVGEPTTSEAHDQRMRYRFEEARIVCIGGARIGLLKAYRDATGWVLLQVQILPSHQGRGIGSRIVRAMLDQARQEHLPVCLNVLKGNPARRLYERLGFCSTGETDSEVTMVWNPQAAAP